MKKFMSLLLLAVIFAGCASVPTVQMLNQSFPPKSENDTVEVFKNKRPERPYIEIAEITYEKNDIPTIVAQAKELGADAIIITGSAGVGTRPTMLAILDQEDFHQSVKTQEYGIKAIAIKYK
jgi:hypothetical protein